MTFGALLHALIVSGALDAGCPTTEAISARLEALGTSLARTDDVQVVFARRGHRRTAVISIQGTEPRELEDASPDCAALSEAAVALLAVLLERTDRPRAPTRERADDDPSAPPTRSPFPRVRIDGGVVASSGIVAPLALGGALGIAYRPVAWASAGIVAETWPARDYAVNEGVVHVAASSLGIAGCLELPASSRFTTAACLRAHGALYALSADGYATARSTDRLLGAGSAEARGSFRIASALGVFASFGVWIPSARLEIAVRGADAGFTTAALAPKAAIGVELNQ